MEIFFLAASRRKYSNLCMYIPEVCLCASLSPFLHLLHLSVYTPSDSNFRDASRSAQPACKPTTAACVYFTVTYCHPTFQANRTELKTSPCAAFKYFNKGHKNNEEIKLVNNERHCLRALWKSAS